MPRILVVDDDVHVCAAVARLLQSHGFEVAVARTGLEALTLAQQVSCPVVITDVRMPGLDGIALTRELLAIDPSTSFILMTGSSHVSLSQTSDASIVSIMSKPWEEDDLLSTLRHAIELHTLRSRPTVTPEPQRLLLLEDNEGDADLMAEYLDGSGYQVRWVRRLGEALEVLHHGRYAVTITDLSLPDARGMDAVTQLARAAPQSALIVTSGIGDEAMMLKAFRAGAEEYLTKDQADSVSVQRAVRFAVERKRAELRISELAHLDALTGLYNRAAFSDRLRRAVARARRSGRPLAVMYLDLDRFKAINDELGHATGDLVLQGFAARLLQCVRPYDVVARLGGDEFVLLLEDVSSAAAAEQVAHRIVSSLTVPVRAEGRELHVGTSIGISLFPQTASSPETLLAGADRAMYTAKRAGTNRYCYAGASEAA